MDLILYVVVIVSFALAVLFDLYDITMTVQGIKAGVAVEGNTFLVGTKPGFVRLLVRDMLIPILPIGLLGLIFGYGNGYACPVFFVPLFLLALKHYHGGRQWVTLLNGGTLTEPQTAWQKFIQG